MNIDEELTIEECASYDKIEATNEDTENAETPPESITSKGTGTGTSEFAEVTVRSQIANQIDEDVKKSVAEKGDEIDVEDEDTVLLSVREYQSKQDDYTFL